MKRFGVYGGSTSEVLRGKAMAMPRVFRFISRSESKSRCPDFRARSQPSVPQRVHVMGMVYTLGAEVATSLVPGPFGYRSPSTS